MIWYNSKNDMIQFAIKNDQFLIIHKLDDCKITLILFLAKYFSSI